MYMCKGYDNKYLVPIFPFNKIWPRGQHMFFVYCCQNVLVTSQYNITVYDYITTKFIELVASLNLWYYNDKDDVKLKYF